MNEHDEEPLVKLGQGDYERDWTPDDGIMVGAISLALLAFITFALFLLFIDIVMGW